MWQRTRSSLCYCQIPPLSTHLLKILKKTFLLKTLQMKNASHTETNQTQPLYLNDFYTPGSQLVGCDSFEVPYQISCIFHIYITSHNNRKITVIKQKRNNIFFEDHRNMRSCTKGITVSGMLRTTILYRQSSHFGAVELYVGFDTSIIRYIFVYLFTSQNM